MSKIGSDTTWAKSHVRPALDAVPNLGHGGWDALEASLLARTPREDWKWKKTSAESTPLRSRVAMGVSNAYGHRNAAGFISVGVRSVGTSVAATVLRASMLPSIRRQKGIRSLPASSRVRIGSTITRSGG